MDNRKFKLLQQKWYRRLEAEGFKDAEDMTKPVPMMKVWHSSYFHKRYDFELFDAKKTYYELASQFLENYELFRFEIFFQSSFEKKIWESHAYGVPLRKIAVRYKMKVCRIHNLIRDLKKQMMETVWES